MSRQEPTMSDVRMKSGQIAGWVLRQERRSIAVWGATTAAVSGFYAVFWGFFADLDDLTALIDSLPEGLAVAMGYDEIGTAVGYLESAVYGLLAPILLSVFAVVLAGRILPGAEERGDLELEFASPVTRQRIVLERTVAVVLGVATVAVMVGMIVAIVVLGIGMDVALGNLAAATGGLFLYGFAIGLLTLAVGVATGRRSYALGAGSWVAVAGFVFNAVAPLVESAAWLTWVSPFAWYSGADMLRAGVDWAAYSALLALGVSALLLGSWRFLRRDLGV